MSCCPGLRKLVGVLSALALLGVAVVLMSSSRSVAEDKVKDESKMLRHIVMFQFKEDASKEDVQKVVDAFGELPSKIPQIADFEFGTNNSPEGLADGYTHCFLVTFKSEEDRAVYLPHEAHKAFVEVLKPHLEKVLVLDYWAGK